jgi:hypothetical protein
MNSASSQGVKKYHKEGMVLLCCLIGCKQIVVFAELESSSLSAARTGRWGKIRKKSRESLHKKILSAARTGR